MFKFKFFTGGMESFSVFSKFMIFERSHDCILIWYEGKGTDGWVSSSIVTTSTVCI